jgi:ABC-type nitrate/sulfonate/bicarbonate transport system permease component
VLLSLIGLAIYYAVEIAERFTIPWHVSQQSTQFQTGGSL